MKFNKDRLEGSRARVAGYNHTATALASLILGCAVVLTFTKTALKSVPQPAQGGIGQTQTPTPPPATLWLGGESIRLEDGGTTFECHVQYSGDHLISIQWMHADSHENRFQEIATPYWPTSVSSTGNVLTLRVAGVRDNGQALIEEWVLRTPQVIEVVNMGTGQQSWMWQMRDPASKVSIWEGTTGPEYIESITTYPGNPDLMIAKLHESNAVWAISTNPLIDPVQIASEVDTGNPAVFVIPALIYTQNRIVRFIHDDYGKVLHFTTPSRATAGFAIYDDDLDQVFDGFIEFYEMADWMGSGMNDGEKIHPPN